MNLTKPIKIISQIAAVAQIIGGILSIYGLYESSFNEGYELSISLLTVVPLIFLNFIAGYCILFTKPPKGVLPLIVTYILQIIQFKFKGVYYFYALGPYLGLGFVKKVNEGISFWWDQSEFIFIIIVRFVDDKIGYFLTFNVVAFFFFVILLLEYRNRKMNQNQD